VNCRRIPRFLRPGRSYPVGASGELPSRSGAEPVLGYPRRDLGTRVDLQLGGADSRTSAAAGLPSFIPNVRSVLTRSAGAPWVPTGTARAPRTSRTSTPHTQNRTIGARTRRQPTPVSSEDSRRFVRRPVAVAIESAPDLGTLRVSKSLGEPISTSTCKVVTTGCAWVEVGASSCSPVRPGTFGPAFSSQRLPMMGRCEGRSP
jgi:hypothetical protein